MKTSTKKLLAKGGTTVGLVTIVGLAGGSVASACPQDYSENYSGDSSQSTTWQDDTSDNATDMSQTGGQGGNGSGNADAQYAVSTGGANDQQNLYNQLDPALREHAALGVSALRATLLNEPDKQAILDAVDQNSVQVADLVEQAYPGTHDQFLSLWRSHIDYYNQYLQASVNHDEAGKAQSKANLAQFTVEVSNLLASANSSVSANELQQSLATHGDQVTMIIDNLVAGNYPAAWQLNHEAYEHMGMVAELLTSSNNAMQE
jgi:hypothetical protein